jgi:hypothetical protein
MEIIEFLIRFTVGLIEIWRFSILAIPSIAASLWLYIRIEPSTQPSHWVLSLLPLLAGVLAGWLWQRSYELSQPPDPLPVPPRERNIGGLFFCGGDSGTPKTSNQHSKDSGCPEADSGEGGDGT